MNGYGTQFRSNDFIIKNSSLYKNLIVKANERLQAKKLTIDECKQYACNDIVSNLTKINTKQSITKISKDQQFCYMVRVDTTIGQCYQPELYFNSFNERSYIAFSTITEENISHYENRNKPYMFAYQVPAEAIVHIFPCDSNTYTKATTEHGLTPFPTFWWNLKDLNDYTKYLRVYNQITCKTKINGEILKPKALIVLGNITEESTRVANRFNLPIISIETRENIVNYTDDLFTDIMYLPKVSKKLSEDYDIKLIENSTLF